MKPILIFLIFVTFSILFAQGTPVSGNVSGIWDETGSPYLVTDNCTIENGQTLEILEDTIIQFQGEFQISVYGTFLANNALFEVVSATSRWGGIVFQNNSSDESIIQNCTFTNGSPAIQISNASPSLINNQISAPDNSPEFIYNGIQVSGVSNCVIDYCVFTNCDNGLTFINESLRAASKPVITNTRVRCSSEGSRANEKGVSIQGNVSIEMDEIIIEDFPIGIQYVGTGTIFDETPVITNTRVRESSESSKQRALQTGIWLENITNIEISNDSIMYYPTGIKIMNGADKGLSKPIITNTRVRNSSESSKQENSGIVFDGYIEANVDDCVIEDFTTGIEYIGTGNATRGTPVITNTRVRSSSEGARNRELQTGIYIADLVTVEIDADSIIGYDTGIDLRKNSREESKPVITNTRVRNSSESRNPIQAGLRLEGFFNIAEIAHNEFTNCNSAIVLIGANTNHEIHHNLIYETSPNATDIGVYTENATGLRIYNNTMYNIESSLSSLISSADVFNNIFWHENPVAAPLTFSPDITVHFNDIATPTGDIYPGVNNINVNPLFSDVINFDFSLSADSPCINAGNPEANVALDPDGSVADMGAFTYQEAGSNSQQNIIPQDDTSQHSFLGGDVRIQFHGNHSETTIYATIHTSDPGIVGELPGSIDTISQNLYWTVISSAGNVGNYDITFDLSNLEGIVNFNTLHILKRDNAESGWVDIPIEPADYNYPFITIRNLDSFSDFVPAGESDNPLPVALSQFNAVQYGTKATVHWTTSSENNLSHWNVYRASTDNFQESQLLNAAPIEAGNSTNGEIYSFTDSMLDFQSFAYYYWLESISFDGNNAYFGPVLLELIEPDNPTIPPANLEYGLHQNYPNPFNPNTLISFALPASSHAELSVYNCKGQHLTTLWKGFVEKDVQYDISWNGLDKNQHKVSSGIYFYRLEASGNQYIKKMIILE